MKDTIKIHETGFFTATFRASNEELSKDSYSRFWKNAKTDDQIKIYLAEVSPEEPFTHCLRNRYFYETIKKLIERKEIEVLINFGCGFSMYPFLFDKKLINIEIDHENLIEYKKKHINNWMQKGKLPKRKIHYLAKDFNLQKDELEKEIKLLTKGKPSFILLEGVIFFLSKTSTDELIELFGRIQTKGSYFGSVSFLDSIIATDCFQRVISFIKKGLALNSNFEFLTLPTSYYETIPNYSLEGHEDYVSLSKKYWPQQTIADGDSILNENLYLLRRE